MTESLSHTLARNVKTARARLGLTQQDVADRSSGGITRIALSTSEQGKREFRLEELPALCKALGMSASELLDGSPDHYAMFPVDMDSTMFDLPTLSRSLMPLLEPLIRDTVRRELRGAFNGVAA